MVIPWQAEFSARKYDNSVEEAQNFISKLDVRQPTTYVTNLEERLELAKIIQRKIRASGVMPEAFEGLKINQKPEQFQFELMHLAVFLYADIAVLRFEARTASGIELVGAVSTTESFLGILKLHVPPSDSFLFLLLISLFRLI